MEPITSQQAESEGITVVDNIYTPIGTSGLERSGGMILEEFLPQLRGNLGRKVYQEMATEPTIGGILLAMVEIISRLEWEIVPPENATPEESGQAQFAQECFEDMEDPWDVQLSQIMSMGTFGWSLAEVLYKRRGGATDDPKSKSRFSDGKIGWRNFEFRAQSTLNEWIFDNHGRVLGMKQQDQWNTGDQAGIKPIPLSRCLLFRTREEKGNPEGVSLLRNAYQPWLYKKRIQEIEAVGVERDLAGIPMVYAPKEWFDGQGDSRLNDMKNLVQKVRKNEASGVLLPSMFDGNNNRLLSFELVTSGGSRQYETDPIVARYNNAIATSMLMDFLTLGHESVGTYSLGTAKISMWQLVIESFAKSIASVINRSAIPRLMELNGWKPDRMPELVFGDVAQADLEVLGAFLSSMIERGVIVPDSTMEEFVRKLANLPPAQSDDAELLPEGQPPAPEQGAATPPAPELEEAAGANQPGQAV